MRFTTWWRARPWHVSLGIVVIAASLIESSMLDVRFMDDCHWSPEGRRAAAELLGGYLNDRDRAPRAG